MASAESQIVAAARRALPLRRVGLPLVHGGVPARGARVELQRRGAGGAERAVLGGPPLERARHRTAHAQGGEGIDALRRLLRRLQLEQG